MNEYKQSTFIRSLLLIGWLIFAYIYTGFISIVVCILQSLISSDFDLPKWVYLYSYSYFILTALFLIWCACIKTTKFAIVYFTITAFINLGIVSYFAEDYTLAMMKGIFPFLYWGN